MPDGFIRYHISDDDLAEEESGEMLPWISADDRLPEDWEIVPAWHRGGIWMSAYRYEGNWYSNMPGTIAMRVTASISHWIEVTPPAGQ